MSGDVASAGDLAPAQASRDIAIDADQNAQGLRFRVGRDLEGLVEDEIGEAEDIGLDADREGIVLGDHGGDQQGPQPAVIGCLLYTSRCV